MIKYDGGGSGAGDILRNAYGGLVSKSDRKCNAVQNETIFINNKINRKNVMKVFRLLQEFENEKITTQTLNRNVFFVFHKINDNFDDYNRQSILCNYHATTKLFGNFKRSLTKS